MFEESSEHLDTQQSFARLYQKENVLVCCDSRQADVFSTEMFSCLERMLGHT